MIKEISVIIPVYNEELHIGNILHQLQDLKKEADIEVIVADGGSTDRIQEMVLPYCDLFIKSEKGKSKQLNTASACAKGNILYFIHADMTLPDGIFIKIKKPFMSKDTKGGDNIFERKNNYIKGLLRNYFSGLFKI